MPQRRKLLQLPLAGKIFLAGLAIVYMVYIVALAGFLYNSFLAPTQSITEHQVLMQPDSVIKHWTMASMQHAININQQDDNASNFAQSSIDTSKSKAARQAGQAPQNGNPSYPLSTVGKIFFTTSYGQDSACSGTAVVSSNRSVVDTAGHCLYWLGGWSQNLIFCPLYDNNTTPYGCWAARDLEVPSDWIHAAPNDYHHDMGMAIVSPNSQGLLTDLVGGSGWAYNQSVNQPFYAYGYPAAPPFDGQTRQICESSSGTSWQHQEGIVVSIPCNMTGGSSGGPWFIRINNKLYLNGHNDFISSRQPGHMFSPYYDDTWYTLYNKAQYT